jgi:hypothetical protein
MTEPIATELSAEMFDRITGQPKNRRNRERRSYRVVQWVAVCPDDGLPESKAFRQVRCDDISRSGISFYTDQPPLDELLIIALGGGAQTTYLKCRVSNCIRIDESLGAFRIGCEFVCRVELPQGNRPPTAANPTTQAGKVTGAANA